MSNPQPSWNSEHKDFAERLKASPGIVDSMDKRVLGQYLADAPSFHDCYYLFWRNDSGAKFLIAFRKDRLPVTEEILPIMELLFDDGQVHEVGQTKFSREFVQGSYIESTAVDQIADLMANTAEYDSYSDLFDFDRTSTGKRMKKAAEEKDGTS